MCLWRDGNKMSDGILFKLQSDLESIQSEINTTSPKEVIDKLGAVIDEIVVNQKSSVTGRKNHLISLEADEIRVIIPLLKRTRVSDELEREIRISLYDKLRDYQ